MPKLSKTATDEMKATTDLLDVIEPLSKEVAARALITVIRLHFPDGLVVNTDIAPRRSTELELDS